jgi:polysaccharide deacetylase family protein (PEP-CTERM system associated)
MTQITNYLTIDVEDYYQVSAFEDVISPDQWDSLESRVEKNTNTLLALLAEYDIKATFFVVGWIAERHPSLVKEIFANGHEIGCHSYLHRRVYNLTPKEFREDTGKAKNALEDIIGCPVLCYRAPSYSITQKSLWALDILKDLGFLCDSSVFPIHHDIYGIPKAPRFPFSWKLTDGNPEPIIQYAANCQLPTANCLLEFPISTARLLGKNIPSSGGGYFRLFPYWLTRHLLKKINNEEKQPFIFYLHPWEVDPEQPRIYNCKKFSRFRHYNNLGKTALRFRRLLKEFSFGPLGMIPRT